MITAPFRTIRPRVWVSVLVVLGLVSAHVATLQTYPLPSCDETGYGDSAYSLLTLGRPAWSVFPVSDRFGRDINVVPHGRAYLLGLGTMLLLFGRTLFVTRFYSLIGGLLAVGLTFLIGQKLYSRRVGVLAALVFVTSFKFFLTSHLGRPETWVTASVLASTYLILRACEARPSARIMSGIGLVSALTLDFHFNALAFLVASVALVLWRFGWQRRDGRSILFFSLGLSLGLLLWVAVHAWPAPVVAWQQLTGYSIVYTGIRGSNPMLGLLQNPMSILSYFMTAYIDTAWPIALIETGLGGLGLGLALYRRAQPDKMWLTVVGVSVVAFAFLFSQRFVEYSVLWTPFLLLGGFAAVEVLVNRLSGGDRWLARAWLLGLAGSISLLQIAEDGWLVYKFKNSNFEQMEAQLADLVPEGTRVLADNSWWWALKLNRVFMSDQYVLAEAPGSGETGGDSQAAVQPWVISLMGRLRPDYVLLDEGIDCASDRGPGWTDLKRYLVHYCEPITDIAGAWVNDSRAKTHLLGQITSIYRCSETAQAGG